MNQLRQIIQLQTTLGHKLSIGQVTIVLQSRALILRWPYGGWVWNKPTAIIVEQRKQTRPVPIVDVTRLAQMGIIGLGLLFYIFILLRYGQHRRS